MKNDQSSVQRRRQNILKMVSEKGEISVRDIALLHNVSEMTVRRDLRLMENRNLLQRTHGGVVSLNQLRGATLFDEVTRKYRDIISCYSARYVEDGDTLFINGSRVALNMLKYVQDKKVTVYTNNGWGIGETYSPDITLCFTGGEMRGRVMIGDYVMRNLLSINVDKIFIGCAAVYDDGEFRYDIPTEIGINEAMISRTNHKIYVLADASKLQRRNEHENTYGSSRYEKQIVLVTDDRANSEIVNTLRRKGIEVVIAH